MTIVFVTGTLEPGKDGAGDQIRILASEMISRGNNVAILSLKDKFIDLLLDDYQVIKDIRIPTLRIPSIWNYKMRFDVGSEWIKKFEAEWVSLHYVNFGFNKRGLPFEMIFSLRKLSGKAKLNIMYWELWCGFGQTSSLKEKLLGQLQRIHLYLMHINAKPDVTFTSANYFIGMLKKIGIKASLVEVVGNIELGYIGNDIEWIQLVHDLGISDILENKSEFIVIGFFGSFYHITGIPELLTNFLITSKKLNKKLKIIIIGNLRSNETLNLFENSNDNFYLCQTGFISAPMINRIMELINFGIVTSESRFITKSSSAVCWKERGIPILISNTDTTYSEDLRKEGVFKITCPDDIENILQNSSILPPQKPIDRVLEIYANLGK